MEVEAAESTPDEHAAAERWRRDGEKHGSGPGARLDLGDLET